jgi:hypothetical protein
MPRQGVTGVSQVKRHWPGTRAAVQTVSPSQAVPQLPQFVSLMGMQAPSQHLLNAEKSPDSASWHLNRSTHGPPGHWQAGDVPHMQVPDTQSGALAPQMVPQLPQFAESLMVSRHVPLQHDSLGSQATPPPHEQAPSMQLSPILHV